MMETQSESYRDRIYARYLSADTRETAAGVEALAPYAPYARYLVRNHFPPDRAARVLDLGCGQGALIHYAREAGYHQISGVDCSVEQVRAAARIGVPGVLEGDLLERLNAQPDSSLDVVLAIDVIEHFDRNELLPLVDEVRRVLAPGGRWIIHTVNAESPFFGRVRYGDLTHETAFTARSIRQLMLASGYSRVECFEDRPIPRGFRSWVRAGAWKVIRLGLRAYLGVETGNSGGGSIFSQNLLAVVVK